MHGMNSIKKHTQTLWTESKIVLTWNLMVHTVPAGPKRLNSFWRVLKPAAFPLNPNPALPTVVLFRNKTQRLAMNCSTQFCSNSSQITGLTAISKATERLFVTINISLLRRPECSFWCLPTFCIMNYICGWSHEPPPTQTEMSYQTHVSDHYCQHLTSIHMLRNKGIKRKLCFFV